MRCGAVRWEKKAQSAGSAGDEVSRAVNESGKMGSWSQFEVASGLDGDANGVGQIDAELASIVSSLSALSNPGAGAGAAPAGAASQLGGFRRSSFGTEGAGELLGGARRTALSVGTAPGAYGSGGAGSALGRLPQHYSASIGGPVSGNGSGNGGGGGGGFFERFGKSLIEGTRELELEQAEADAAEPPRAEARAAPAQSIWNADAPVFKPSEPYGFEQPAQAQPVLQAHPGMQPGFYVPYAAPAKRKPPKKQQHSNPYLDGKKKGPVARGVSSATSSTSPPPPKGSKQGTRSPLLEEFRSNNGRVYALGDILGYVLEFCKDQHGSRFIQHELSVVSGPEKEVIFNEVRDHAIELSDDVFGNYVIQKFFEFGSTTQKAVLVSQFRGKMKKLSMQMYACRVIQKVLEYIELPQRIALVQELSSCVLQMIKDQNGNHVIQKAIERIPMAQLPFILDSLDGQIYHLSTHSYGCRVIQRLLEFGSEQDQSRILAELKDFIPYSIQDQYGNYVIQHILQQKDSQSFPEMRATKQVIVNTVSQNVVEFSKHKFASNVVEKAILYGSPEQKALIVAQILPRDEAHARDLEDSAPMILMMRDQFANYVVQKLVGVSEGQDKRLIVIAIRAYLDKLNKSDSMGNRHLASVEKLASLVESVKL